MGNVFLIFSKTCFAMAKEINAFGSVRHRDIARQAVRESIVVLDAKNNVLPLKKDGQTIGLAGVLADDLGAQCGGWTIAWQGGNGDITDGTSILEGFNKLTSNQVMYLKPRLMSRFFYLSSSRTLIVKSLGLKRFRCGG